MRPSALRTLFSGFLIAAASAACAAAQEPASPLPDPGSIPRPAQNSDPVLARTLREWPAARIPTVRHPGEWGYEEGFVLDGIVAEWRATADGRLFDYVRAAIDRSVDREGVIHLDNGAAFPTAARSLDDIEMGRSVLTMYRVTQDPRYYTAAKFLHDQIGAQPRNSFGGYWHKGAYPDQMWLDGAYMAEPFLANYSRTFNHPHEMDGIAEQLLLMSAHLRDRRTGLLHHGWDATKRQEWADKTTGQSPEIWARGMGWYAMALVDVLDRMAPIDPQRAAIEDLTRRILEAIAHAQDTTTGLWWQVMDKPNVKGNYFEASASCMFVYAMARAIREDVLPLTFEVNVSKGWAGIQSHFVKPDGTLTGTVQTAGLGGDPYRAGTFDYYISEPVVDNDAKGVGAYLLALSEIIQRRQAGDLLRRAHGKTVLFDAWFNSDTREKADGGTELFHYKTNDDSSSGYSWFNRMFLQYAMRSDTLDHAPGADDLKGVDIYVIASPDLLAVHPEQHYADPSSSGARADMAAAVPHFMDKESADAIEAWVKAGGTLVLMGNDAEHADQTHLDVLSDRFGVHFNPVTVNRQRSADSAAGYANTLVPIPAGAGGIFRHDHTALMKDTCTLTVSGPAKPLLTHIDAESPTPFTVMAESRIGKGLVFANVDPWLYNEYTDGRQTPLHEDNFAAGQELVHWLITQATAH